MGQVRFASMRRAYEAGRNTQRANKLPTNPFITDVRKWLADGQMSPMECSIRDCFETFVDNGRELAESYNPQRVNHEDHLLLEAAGAVDMSAFSNIFGQITYTLVMERWNNPDLCWSQLVDNVQTNYNGQKVPGVGGIGDQFTAIGEGQEYPMANFSEEWVDTPQTTKRGGIVAVTKEAVFFDNTGEVLNRAASYSDAFALNKEKRVLDTVLGITTSYKYMGAAAQATYVDSPYDNLAASNTLTDYTSIDTARRLFQAMVDPTTGEPIAVVPNTLIYPAGLDSTVDRILNSTQVVQGAISGTVPRTYSPTPGPTGKPRPVTGLYVASRLGNNTTWFLGDPKRAFKYMMNWDITSVPMPNGSYDEWRRDIVAGYKVTERGTPAVIEPRYMVKCT